MSFRRDSSNERQWQQWLAEHRAVLDNCGLPPAVLNSRRDWEFFLQEGLQFDELGKHAVWTCAMLTRQQAERLIGLLETPEVRETWCIDGLLSELRLRLDLKARP